MSSCPLPPPSPDVALRAFSACDPAVGARIAPVLRMTTPPGSERPRDPSGRGAPDRALQDAWVARLKEGDEGALAEVVEAYKDRITNVVAGMMSDRDAVDDVVAETFTKAFFRIRAFHGDAGLYTWLYRVAINGAKDHAKKRRRRPALALDDVPAGPSSLPSRPLGTRVETLEDRELRTAVRLEIERLPARFRCVLVLRELEGLRYDEIAQILGISQGTVESRLHRARQRLKRRLARFEASAGA